MTRSIGLIFTRHDRIILRHDKVTAHAVQMRSEAAIRFRRPHNIELRRSNRVFVLDMEQWMNSTPSVQSSRVRGSLPNHSTWVLWIWRKHSTAPLRESCGDYGVWAVHSLYPDPVW